MNTECDSVNAANTIPSAAAESVASSTANVSATGVIASPTALVADASQSSLNGRSRSGARLSALIRPRARARCG